MADVFDIQQTSWWNYTNKERQGYTLSITGDVVEISARQKVEFGSKQPVYDKNGKPQTEFLVTICTAEGDEIIWTIKNRAVINTVAAALQATGLPGRNLAELGGLNITVSTQEGSYSRSNPRPFFVVVNAQGTHEFRGAMNKVQPQPVQVAGQAVQYQPVQPVQYQQVPQQPPVQQVPQVPQGADPYSDEYDFQ